MNKEGLVSLIAEKGEVSKSEAKRVLELVLDSIVEGAKTEGKVEIKGSFSLELVDVQASKRRNPQTGDEVNVPAHKDLKIKLSKTLRKSVR